MSFILLHPDQEIESICTFIKQTLQTQQKKQLVVAVSGGIDSTVALTLAARAVGPESVTALLLPFAEQTMENAQTAIAHNHIPKAQVMELNIEPAVVALQQLLGVSDLDRMRRGNLMARTRMIAVYDQAKKLDALVVGTENKSEHYLGYFTRFGDAASDMEPLVHLYKTQVRQIADQLGIPSALITQTPTAGLWEGQSDEAELGFSYQDADLILYRLLDLNQQADQIQIPGIASETIQKVATRVNHMHFKHEVPYTVKGVKETA
jgi:NAD+ synthase